MMEAIIDTDFAKREIEANTGFHVGTETGRCDCCNDPGAVEILEMGSQLDEPSTESGNALACPSCAISDLWQTYQEWTDACPEWVPSN
jgi:hypothetical protein